MGLNRSSAAVSQGPQDVLRPTNRGWSGPCWRRGCLPVLSGPRSIGLVMVDAVVDMMVPGLGVRLAVGFPVGFAVGFAAGHAVGLAVGFGGV